MSDALKQEENKNTNLPQSPEQVFIEFKYPEIKDLLKHFLTLISGALVFSITFSEKIVKLDDARHYQKILVLVAWLLLILAMGACGYGLYTLFRAAEHVVDSKGQTYSYEDRDRLSDFDLFVRRSYFLQDAAGVLFGLGLCLLVIAAAGNFIK